MLALSDTQDVACLRFGREISLECAARILKIVNVVKSQPTAFLCLLTGIRTSRPFVTTKQRVLILEAIKQAMPFIDDGSAPAILLPLASSSERVPLLLDDYDPQLEATVAAEMDRIRSLLQAKHAASLISSTAQLQLLSCARSAAVAQPAMGWLRIYEPL
jgi:hypothetical protein